MEGLMWISYTLMHFSPFPSSLLPPSRKMCEGKDPKRSLYLTPLFPNDRNQQPSCSRAQRPLGIDCLWNKTRSGVSRRSFRRVSIASSAVLFFMVTALVFVSVVSFCCGFAFSFLQLCVGFGFSGGFVSSFYSLAFGLLACAVVSCLRLFIRVRPLTIF